MTAIVKCKCAGVPAAIFQDKTYGAGMRVAVATAHKVGDDKIDVRCTVCGSVHQVNKSQNK